MQDLVVVVNLNTSACRMIAQKLRAEHFYCRIVSATCAAEDIQRMNARGILLAAGASGEAVDVPYMMDYLQTGLPMLCVGDAALTLCQRLGGELLPLTATEGTMQIHLDASDNLLTDIEDTDRYQPQLRCMSIAEEQAAPIATTEQGLLGFHARHRDVWGFSFQMERNDPFTSHLLIRFCQHICVCTPWWTHQALIDRAREEIDRAANGGSALCSLSGGVDSGVCAVLGNLAIGHRLHCIFIDSGLLRKDESEQVMAYYHDSLGLNLRRIDAREEFLTALAGVTDAAEKERIVTERMMSILSREAAAIDDIRLVIQGTNVSDTLYQPHTGSTIDGLPIIEPVRELFKDEIRQVGQELGMPPALVNRQPFPGSGLASRILTNVTAERLEVLREADAIFRHEVEESNQNRRLWQYFAALTESPFIDNGYVITLRAVQAAEGAGGNTARFTPDLLERVAAQILTQCPQVQRVMYDLTPSKSYQQANQ